MEDRRVLQEFREGKKEAPAIDEGEEARLCGGLWTKFLSFL